MFIAGNTLKMALNVGEKYLYKKKRPIINYAIESINDKKVYKEYINLISCLPQSFSIAMKLSSFDFNVNTIMDIAERCQEQKIKLFIDAENQINNDKYQSITSQLMLNFNKTDPIIYKTYQMYRKDSLTTLHKDIFQSTANNTYFCAKLVRGAYWNSENHLGHIFTDKIHTDYSYNRAIIDLYEMKNNKRLEVVLATHNEFSVDMGLLLNHKRKLFSFAHLQGMQDHYYEQIAKQSHDFKDPSVYVYIPYGPYNKMIPYLLRRLYENIDMIKYR